MIPERVPTAATALSKANEMLVIAKDYIKIDLAEKEYYNYLSLACDEIKMCHILLRTYAEKQEKAPLDKVTVQEFRNKLEEIERNLLKFYCEETTIERDVETKEFITMEYKSQIYTVDKIHDVLDKITV